MGLATFALHNLQCHTYILCKMSIIIIIISVKSLNVENSSI